MLKMSARSTGVKLAAGVAVVVGVSLVPALAQAAAPAASIAGTVVAAGSGQPVAGINVTLLTTKTNGGFGGPVSGPGIVALTTTNAKGSYKFSKLAPSDATGYWVCFDGSFTGPLAIYEGQCYSGAEGYDPEPDPFDFIQVPDDSTTVHVAAGKAVAGINAAMVDDLPNSIAGVVSGQNPISGAAALKGVVVTAIGPAGTTVGTGTTDAHGDYAIFNLPTDTTGYDVCFKATGGLALLYRDECYRNVAWKGTGPAPAKSSPVPVSTDMGTNGVDAELPL